MRRFAALNDFVDAVAQSPRNGACPGRNPGDTDYRKPLYPFHDADFALGAVPERAQGLAIGRAVMRGDRGRDRLELDQHGALPDPLLVDLHGLAARQKTPARADFKGVRAQGSTG